MTITEYEARIRDLLEANNRYLQRARMAEMEVSRLLREGIARHSTSVGCICPRGANIDCKRPSCPRQGVKP